MALNNYLVLTFSQAYTQDYTVTIKEFDFNVTNSGTILTSVDSNITSIPNDFIINNSNIISVVIPDTVLTIGTQSFLNDINLTSITFGNSITTIGTSAFSNTNLTSVTLPNTVTTLLDNAFSMCAQLTEVTLSNTLTFIGPCTFQNCPLTSIILPDTLTCIGNLAFQGNSFSSIIIPDSVTTIGDGVYLGSTFENCSNLTSVTLSKNINELYSSTFNGCSLLSSIVIPNNVTQIYDNVFFECPITELIIPGSVTYIYDNAFSSMSSLQTVIFKNPIAITMYPQNTGFFDSSLQSVAFYNTTSLSSINSNLLAELQSRDISPQLFSYEYVPPLQTSIITVNSTFNESWSNIPTILNLNANSNNNETNIIYSVFQGSNSATVDSSGVVSINSSGPIIIQLSQLETTNYTEVTTYVTIYTIPIAANFSIPFSYNDVSSNSFNLNLTSTNSESYYSVQSSDASFATFDVSTNNVTLYKPGRAVIKVIQQYSSNGQYYTTAIRIYVKCIPQATPNYYKIIVIINKTYLNIFYMTYTF